MAFSVRDVGHIKRSLFDDNFGAKLLHNLYFTKPNVHIRELVSHRDYQLIKQIYFFI